MSEFLSGSVLAERIKTMIHEQQQITIATAFIGDGFDDLIRARPKTFPPVTVYCDLTMGGTNPAPLKSLLKNAPSRIILKSCGGLHAKVILGRQSAIVSSANLSRNAVGDMTPGLSGDPKLHEAGIALSASEDGMELAKIRKWLAELSAREITKQDDWQLMQAKAAFNARATLVRPTPKAPPGEVVPTLLATLSDPDNRKIFQRLIVVVTTAAPSREARAVAKTLKDEGRQAPDGDYYEDRDKIGAGMVIADFEGFKRKDDLEFQGYYRMRDDARATIPHPDGKRPFWMQLITRDDVDGWLPSDRASMHEFTRLVRETVKRRGLQRKSCQFPLLDLLKTD